MEQLAAIHQVIFILLTCFICFFNIKTVDVFLYILHVCWVCDGMDRVWLVFSVQSRTDVADGD